MMYIEMMNAYFNKLPGDKQSTILQMPKEQREIVMRTIMAKSFSLAPY